MKLRYIFIFIIVFFVFYAPFSPVLSDNITTVNKYRLLLSDMGDLYVFNLITRKFTKLTIDGSEGFPYRYYSWSPNGKKILYIHRANIGIIDVATETKTALTYDGSEGRDIIYRHASFSSDGNFVVFNKFTRKTSTIAVINLHTKERHIILQSSSDVYTRPLLSPDKKKLLYLEQKSKQPFYQLNIISLDSQWAKKELLFTVPHKNLKESDEDVSWCADSNSVVFIGYRLSTYLDEWISNLYMVSSLDDKPRIVRLTPVSHNKDHSPVMLNREESVLFFHGRSLWKMILNKRRLEKVMGQMSILSHPKTQILGSVAVSQNDTYIAYLETSRPLTLHVVALASPSFHYKFPLKQKRPLRGQEAVVWAHLR